MSSSSFYFRRLEYAEIEVKIVQNERDSLKAIDELNNSITKKGEIGMEMENILNELAEIINGEQELPLELQVKKVKELDRIIYKFKQKHKELFAKKERKIHQVKGKIIGEGRDYLVKDQPNNIAKTFMYENDEGMKTKAVIYLEKENNFDMKNGMIFEMEGYFKPMNKTYINKEGEERTDFQFNVIDCKRSLELANINDNEFEYEKENESELER